MVALSKSGSSSELNDFCARARALCSCLVVVTAAAGTPLAALADHVIRFDLETDTDLGSVVATGSSLAIATAVDALAEVGRIARKYRWDDLLSKHPLSPPPSERRKHVPLAADRYKKEVNRKGIALHGSSDRPAA